jgi:hypothetical protein
VSVHPLLLRRATVAYSVALSRAPVSNSSATSLSRPAWIRSARAISSGRPGASSSPVMATVMVVPSSAPAACSALSA